MGTPQKTSFFDKTRTGWDVIVHSLKVIRTYPSFLLPMLFCWVIYAPTIIYFKFCYDWDALGGGATLGLFFLIIFFFSLLFSLSSLMLIELIEQVERGEKVSFTRAVLEVIFNDLLKALPIILIWAVIWFILEIIEAMLSRKKKNETDDDRQLNMENAAKTLAGYQDFSLASLSFDAIKKGVRMVAFLIYPAIAWEDESTVNAIKKGFTTLRLNVTEFVSGYMITWAAAGIIFLPPGIMFQLGTGRDGRPPLIDFPPWVWGVVIIYIAFGWSFYLYLEQMFAALLYMWNMKWQEEVKRARELTYPPPRLRDVKQPDLLDGIPDL